ncbi:hypothetical protein [Hyphomonas sp.]|uniref:DUF7483 domain-containing protein n=1 Tax=Hyphomonas sp. TaxID=87 RepID=UPI0025B96E24|nr:hypothetical protein [Hyphomonas sp.]
MAYTTINKSTAHFNTKVYTGTGSAQSITGLGFRPDWVWGKNRSTSNYHDLEDSVRGATKRLSSNVNDAEATETVNFTSFDSDGFSVGSGANVNGNGNNIVVWNWLAGGASPSQTYTVKVVSDSGNKYRFDDFGTSAVTLDLQEGGTYTFDQSDSSNSGHPLRFYTASDKSGGEYTTGVTTTGTAGSSGAKTVITVAASAPTLYYQCSNHAGMGGQANTNSTFGSSNFSGNIQSTVSANTAAGFSIVRWSGSAANATIGHNLGAAPKMIICKDTNDTYNWGTYHQSIGNTKYLYLNSDAAEATSSSAWNNTTPTSTVFSVGNAGATNASGTNNMIAYCFAEKVGYSKFGSYTGNGSTNGEFIYLGFRPAFVIIKRINSSKDWFIWDNKTSSINPTNSYLRANTSGVAGSYDWLDLVSNGIKIRNTSDGANGSGDTYIYMAFGQSLVGSNDIAALAK